jgi:hypothetical protein
MDLLVGNNSNNNSSANLAARRRGNWNGGRLGHGRGGGGGGGGCGRNGGRHGAGNGGGSNSEQSVCQLCGMEGHTVLHCYKRFDASFTDVQEKTAASATTSYGVDSNWYLDTGATDHIMVELDMLTVREKYNGGE